MSASASAYASANLPPPPSSSHLARWTDDEHQILVQRTNGQIELESRDRTQEISWAEHWRQVSAQLLESGYNRTNTACQSYWKRVVDAQRANEEAAGPRWDDSEHQILLGMTEDQLALEREDPTSVIPWPKHWKRVSLILHKSGYNRTPNACSAYWLKVGYDFSVDNYEPAPEIPRVQKHVVAGEEAEVEVESEIEIEIEKPFKPNKTSLDDSGSSYSRDEELLPEELPEPRGILLSNASSICTPSGTPVPSEIDPSEDESYQPRRREATKSRLSQSLPKAAPTAPKTRSPKGPLRRGFRFNAHQRAVLEAQAAQHGTYPDGNQRLELARELDVDEKTVRNWFIYRRSLKRQIVLSNASISGLEGQGDSFLGEGFTPAAGPPGSGAKRPPLTMDSNEHGISVGEEIGNHQSKRSRTDEYHKGSHGARQFGAEKSHENAVTGPVDLGMQRGPSSGSEVSLGPSRDSSLAGSLASRETTTPSISPFSPVNIAVRQNGPSEQTAPQMLRPEKPGPQNSGHEPLSGTKKSHYFLTPASGADWNPVNSAIARNSNPVSLASTPTPTPHTLPSHHGHLISQHPYGKPVSSTLPLNTNSASAPPKLSPITNESDEKQWMSGKVRSFQTEIEDLNRDKAARLHGIDVIDRRMEEVAHDENTLDEEKKKAILEAVSQIEERYRGRKEGIKSQQRELIESREAELEGLNRNDLDLRKKRTALVHFQALVGLYDET